MGRAPCCSKVGLHRGAWSSEEDKLLINYIQTHGEGQWRALPSKAGLLRCGKSCRLRWMNYLRPGIKRGNFTSEENDVIIRLRSVHGNRWSFIATELPGRTDNEIKNYWNAHLRKASETTANHHSNPNKTKKKRKPAAQKPETTTTQEKPTTQEKSKKVNDLDSGSTSSTSSNSSKNESGASSSCTFDFGDDEFDFSWSNWDEFLEVEGTSTMIDGQNDELFQMDDWDFGVAKEDESLMFESLYHEYLNLLNDQDVDEGK